MQENREEIEYETPELVKVGAFSELTLGLMGFAWDQWGGFQVAEHSPASPIPTDR